MQLHELLELAIQSLRRNGIRTILTMLGIIIGIASVITIMSLGEGSTQSIVGEISAFGANIITVSPGRIQRGPGQPGGTVKTLSETDAKSIAGVEEVIHVSRVQSGSVSIVKDDETSTAQVSGVDANYDEIQSYDLEAGNFFDEDAVLNNAKIVVLGDQIIEELFGEDFEQEVIGETVRLDGKVFRIIGVLPDTSSALIPFTTAQNQVFGQSYLDSISVYVSDSELIEQVSDDIETELLSNHQIEDAEDADFSIRNTQSFVDTISSVTGTMTAALSGIAAISLLVGGVGIMNIMLVSVTERTKEIGLLKAIGAKDTTILQQFLIEAIVLTVAGGVVGIIIGATIAFVASSMMSIPFVVPAVSIVLSFGVSALVGLVFGYYPAKQAAKLQPIDALRYE